MYYLINRSSLLTPILQKLADDFQISRRPLLRKTVSYFDTFDGRLYKNDLIFQQEDAAGCLSALKKEQVLFTMKIPEGKSTFFWWDFPEKNWQKKLAALLGIRALIPLLSVHFKIRPYDILNQDLKTITRFLLKTPVVSNKDRLIKLKPVLEVLPIRGYRENFQRINQVINELGLVALQQPYPLQLFSEAQLNPGEYSSKINIQLDPRTPAREALQQIFRQFLSIIHLNLPGIRADWDSEFLHDFRVALRRTRSILGQAKYVFPAGQSKRFRQRLGQLQKSTNQLRDLDVYLLRKGQYRTLLPKNLQPGVDILFNSIAEERRQEQQRIRSVLSNPHNLKILTEWASFLGQQKMPSSRNAGSIVFPFSQRIIRKRLERVFNQGNKLLPQKPSKTKLHRLRIECKKLRYLLEFFFSLYPEKKISLLIEHLKLLQDLLGDINDLSFQIRDLEQRMDTPHRATEADWLLPAAMGGLLTHFYQKQQELIEHFQETFRQFNSPEVVASSRQLFYQP